MRTVQVDEIIPHPQYNDATYANNIAIIRLSTDARFDDRVRPVCLWNGSESAEMIHRWGTVVGWDIVRSSTELPSNTLQEGLMKVTDRVDCLDATAAAFLHPTLYCARYRDGNKRIWLSFNPLPY